jgi:hypothetical protein
VGERIGWAFEYREADASAVLEPAENNEKKVMFLAGCSEVVDDECDLTGALFDVKVAEVKAAKV